jgi:hypothetical protein
MNADDLRTIGLIIAAIILASLLLSALMLLVAYRQVRKIDIPPGAGFAETLHYTPFSVVLGIDVLDLALDVLAAPIAWVVLDRLGLKALRAVSAIEALIPGTQLIPTLTLAWFIVRLFNIHDDALLRQGPP